MVYSDLPLVHGVGAASVVPYAALDAAKLLGGLSLGYEVIRKIPVLIRGPAN